jgi:hypothetical protein
VLSDFCRATNVELPSTALPQQELHDALNVKQRSFQLAGFGRNDAGIEARDRAIRPLERESQGDGAVVLGKFAIGPIKKGCR